jgi:hypothetical protein
MVKRTLSREKGSSSSLKKPIQKFIEIFHYYKTWVQFTSPCSLDQGNSPFFHSSLFITINEFTQNSVKSLDVQRHILL